MEWVDIVPRDDDFCERRLTILLMPHRVPPINECVEEYVLFQTRRAGRCGRGCLDEVRIRGGAIF